MGDRGLRIRQFSFLTWKSSTVPVFPVSKTQFMLGESSLEHVTGQSHVSLRLIGCLQFSLIDYICYGTFLCKGACFFHRYNCIWVPGACAYLVYSVSPSGAFFYNWLHIVHATVTDLQAVAIKELVQFTTCGELSSTICRKRFPMFVLTFLL